MCLAGLVTVREKQLNPSRSLFSSYRSKTLIEKVKVSKSDSAKHGIIMVRSIHPAGHSTLYYSGITTTEIVRVLPYFNRIFKNG